MPTSYDFSSTFCAAYRTGSGVGHSNELFGSCTLLYVVTWLLEEEVQYLGREWLNLTLKFRNKLPATTLLIIALFSTRMYF